MNSIDQDIITEINHYHGYYLLQYINWAYKRGSTSEIIFVVKDHFHRTWDIN